MVLVRPGVSADEVVAATFSGQQTIAACCAVELERWKATTKEQLTQGFVARVPDMVDHSMAHVSKRTSHAEMSADPLHA